jgi:hypothetical protein
MRLRRLRCVPPLRLSEPSRPDGFGGFAANFESSSGL